MVEAVVEVKRSDASQELVVNLEPMLPIILGDAAWLTQALNNLIGNAIKFSPVGGRVVITARARPRTIEVTVADQGLGVPAAARDLIFDPSARSLRAEQSGNPGSGLGLLITRHIVKLHSGQIWVEPNTPTGSIFRLEFPRPVKLRSSRSEQ